MHELCNIFPDMVILRISVYNPCMTWDYTKKEYAKQAKADPIWLLERQINHGLQGKKLPKKLLMKHFDELKIPDDRRAFLKLLLWGSWY